MADFATALRSRLTSDTPVSAITGTRVYWSMVPQSAALPYVRLQTISDVRPEHLQGYDGARQTRVQCDCFASTYAVARDLAEKIVGAVALPAVTGGVKFGRTKAEGPIDLGEDVEGVGFIHRASLDLLAEHSLA